MQDVKRCSAHDGTAQDSLEHKVTLVYTMVP